MNVDLFDYELPESLIAQYPAAQRTDSRLLHFHRHTGDIEHRQFTDIVELLNENDLLIFNDTRVIPARLFGEKSTGGKVEVLIERVTGGSRGIAQIRASKPVRPDSEIQLPQGLSLRVIDKVDDMYLIQAVGDISLAMVMQAVGHVPLPPYVNREDEVLDKERYQTVYAARDGAVAAPTAGLHFDEKLLESVNNKGIDSAFVTLHVGAGTFQPVRVDDITDHSMHAEYVEVSSRVCNQIREAKARGGRVIAVGTTSVRCIETASVAKGWVEPFYGDTEIFIYPGYEYRLVDAMITNFHLPQSSLLMLVSAFAGIKNTMATYRSAVSEQYRFFSYGDAMFIG